MNEDMKKAWVEVCRILGEPTKEELDVFLRTWQLAVQAERNRQAREASAHAAHALHKHARAA